MIENSAKYNKTVLGFPMPEGVRRLPIGDNGFPVPWFVQWLKDGKPCEVGEGKPDFRVMDARKWAMTVRHSGSHCWVCGGHMGQYKAFVIGPMCCINRVTSEPPCHKECAIYSAQVCPFLANPNMVRNEKDKVQGQIAGIHIDSNPGGTCVYITKKFNPMKDGKGGLLLQLYEPTSVHWYVRGEPATRAQIDKILQGRLPLLRDMANQDGPEAVRALERMIGRAQNLLPVT